MRPDAPDPSIMPIRLSAAYAMIARCALCGRETGRTATRALGAKGLYCSEIHAADATRDPRLAVPSRYLT